MPGMGQVLTNQTKQTNKTGMKIWGQSVRIQCHVLDFYKRFIISQWGSNSSLYLYRWLWLPLFICKVEL